MNTSAAIYCRLSQDDGNAGESNSIQTQKTLLTQYCSEHHIPISGYYCDDGWSGTNFERPQFKQMIEDIEAGKIDTVIVKDLSRFGREYAQMGLYIEHYFEEKGIRFISVGENIDSKNGTDNLVFPFTNVVNSYYARQASAKTKAAHRARAKEGMFIGSRAPFGYNKDPNDRHKLIVDPPAAEVVQMIFHMFSEGIGYVKMTKILRERKILNPQAYFNRNHPTYYESDYWRKDFDWHASSIRAILNNPVYLGQTVFGRRKTKGFFDKRVVEAPEEEWIICKGTHPPLISAHYISWKALNQIVLEDIKRNAGIAKRAEKKYLEMLIKLKTDKQKQDEKKMKTQLQRIEKRLSEISVIIKRLYEDLALGRISEERYQELSSGLNSEEKELKNSMTTLKSELEKTQEVFQNVEKFIPLIQKYTDIKELNAYILNELIERIVVHEKVIDENGNKTQKVEIYYKFVGIAGMAGG